jgi:hypothetical protein
MDTSTTDGLSFLTLNLLLIAGVFLLIFVYFLFLIRKRWKRGFLHHVDDKKKEK